MAIEPTKTQLENRKRASQGLPVIDSSVLSTTDTPITPIIPEIPTTPDISGLDASMPEEIKLSQPEQDISESIKRATELTGLGEAEKGRRAELELEDPIIVAQRKLQTDLASQLGFLQAEALKKTTRAEERLAPTFAIRGEQAAIERARAVKALSLSAQVDASKGLLSSALEKVDRSIEAEFGPRKAELQSLLQNIELLKADPRLTREEEKRADAREIAIQKELQGIQEQADEKKAKEEAINTAISLGADRETILRMNQAPSSTEAMAIASEKGFVDTTAQLERKLLEEQIQSQITNRAINLANLDLKKKALSEEEQGKIDAKKEEIEKNTARIPAIDDKLNQLKAIYNPETGATHKGLNSVVGPTLLELPFGVDVSPGRISLADRTGASQQFLGQVKQLVSKETIDTLVNLKARGGTLGALSDQERIMLQNASTAIGGWAITDKDDNVTGYNIDEDSFKKEIAIIINLTTRAKNKALGDIVPQDDIDEINSL
jgi:hypothetical protein